MAKSRFFKSAVLGAVLVYAAWLAACSQERAKESLSRKSAQEIAVSQVFKNELGKRAIFGSPEPVAAGVMIGTWPTPEKVKVEAESWFFFVDEAPGANWEHPAKFVLVERASRKVSVIDVTTPPDGLEKMVPLNPAAESQMKTILRNIGSIVQGILVVNRCPVPKRSKYALLVSGGWNASANYARYWNDLAAIYKALKDKYGYTDAEIVVLYANGSHLPGEDLDGDGHPDIDYAATKANLTSAMESIAGNLKPDGKFFFYSTNHGGHEEGHDATLYLWGEIMKDDEFAPLTKKIHAKNANYTMEQCFGAGMMDDILQEQTYPCTSPEVCVMTAARHDEYSWAADTEGPYDEYVYHWTAAVYGQTPDGTPVDADADHDGMVSMKEAHEYAKAHDSKSEHPVIGSCIVSACDSTL